MKRTLLFLACVLTSIMMLAQDVYHTFLEEGKVWTYHYQGMNGRSFDIDRVVDGDTIIGDQSYKKICDKMGGKYQYALREEGKQVYIVYDHQETPSLLYDFGKNKGDVIYQEVDELSGMVSEQRVIGVDTIDIDGLRLRRLQIWGKDYSIQNPVNWEEVEVPWQLASYWIEGIGSECLLESSFRQVGNYYNLKSCQIKGRTYSQQELLQEPSKLQDDYLPFVEMGKQWNVVIPYGEPHYGGSISGFWMVEEVEHDGKLYAHTQRNLYAECEVQEAGLFREENRRVYKYDETTGRDIMMYDFSLKEGDTFTYEFGSDQPVNCKVLKEGWLEDGPDIVSSCNSNSDGTLDIKYRKLRTWTIGRENESGEYEEVATWVECIGALENVFGLIDNGLMKFENSLAYVLRKDLEVGDGKYEYLPFSFYSISMHGCNLPTSESNEEYDDELNHLSYELEGDRLHVYGDIYTQCGPNNYAFFYEWPTEFYHTHPEYYDLPTDDPSVQMIEFLPWEVAPVADCMSHHYTDFYVPGFDPNLNYYVSDNNGEIHPVINKMAYRPMIEDDKVWTVRLIPSWADPDEEQTEKYFEYYYFDGDTIINGQTAKRMLYDRIGSNWDKSGEYIGAWYEQDKKVYYASKGKQQFELLYDFTLSTGDIIQSEDRVLQVTKMSSGIPGFKGTYYDLKYEYQTSIVERWLEGVGSQYYPWLNLCARWAGAAVALLVCKAGDEIIYYNSEEEDPFSMGAKKRFDFTHTIKTKPRTRSEAEEQPLYGEYNDQQLGINLDPLDEAYMVRITDESDEVVYEKAINAGNIVGLNIDISAYPEGRYTVTIENNGESFTGEFDTKTTGIQELKSSRIEELKSIYNLQGQRVTTPVKGGIYIQNGKKLIIK